MNEKLTEELKQLREALMQDAIKARDRANAQVIALEALTQGVVNGNSAAQEVDYSDQLTKAKRLLVDLHKKLAAAQAKIDALMLEYCPDEMTQEQIDNWVSHQRVVKVGEI